VEKILEKDWEEVLEAQTIIHEGNMGITTNIHGLVQILRQVANSSTSIMATTYFLFRKQPQPLSVSFASTSTGFADGVVAARALSDGPWSREARGDGRETVGVSGAEPGVCRSDQEDDVIPWLPAFAQA
jgi:hypothetical protein